MQLGERCDAFRNGELKYCPISVRTALGGDPIKVAIGDIGQAARLERIFPIGGAGKIVQVVQPPSMRGYWHKGKKAGGSKEDAAPPRGEYIEALDRFMNESVSKIAGPQEKGPRSPF